MKQILGCLTTTSFVHQTSPDERVAGEGNKLRMHTTLVVTASGTTRRVPYITSNSVRGKLRRFARDRLLRAMNQPVSRELYSVLSSGTGRRRDIGGTPTVSAVIESTRNVFAGVFGGGGYMLPSRYAPQTLLPLLGDYEHIIHPLLRPYAIASDKQPRGDTRDFDWLLQDVILTSRDDVLQGLGGEFIRDYAKSFSEWLEENVGSAAAKRTSKAAKAAGEKVEVTKSVALAGFNVIQGMVPGVPLGFEISLDDALTDAQIGLLLLAVQDFCNGNRIGGAGRRGFGTFIPSLAFHDMDADLALPLFGVNDRAAGQYRIDRNKPVLARYVDAAEKALSEMTVSALEVVYPSSSTSAA